MNHEAVEAHREFLVGGGLQRFRRPRPCARASGERFGGDEILAIDVRDRGGFADIGVVAVLLVVHAGTLRPRGRHRHVVAALHFHAVADEGAAFFVRFTVVTHAALFENFGDQVVVIFGEKIGERAAKIPKEAIAGFGAVDDAAGENGNPRLHVVAAALLEFGEKSCRSSFACRLPNYR